MLPTTIDQVIARLDTRIATARERGSPNGYFAALYRKVTVRIRDGVKQGEFEDNPRMERLDVTFANRYLAACEALDAGARPTAAWQVSFDAARAWPPIVLQHLLLGMNAHINLDLGIAAVETAPGQALPALRKDFDHINDILGSLLDGVKADLTAIWPALGVFDAALGTKEDAIANFSMQKARASAWQLAECLAATPAADHARVIHERDCVVATFGKVLWKPGVFAQIPALLVRATERGSVRRKIDLLAS